MTYCSTASAWFSAKKVHAQHMGHCYDEFDHGHVLLCCCRYMSAVEYSHTTMVADLTWLPGIEIDRQGKVFGVR